MAEPKAKMRTSLLQTKRERVTLQVYKELDQDVSEELSRLKAAGIVPSCSKGCSHCCRQEVLTPPPEAGAIASHLRRLDVQSRNAIRERTEGWLEWYENTFPMLLERGVERARAFYELGPQCLFLEEDACQIYPVRPPVCRTHFVSSHPDTCRPLNDPQAAMEEPTAMTSVVLSTRDHAQRLRGLTEKGGRDFMSQVHPLPLAVALALRWR